MNQPNKPTLRAEKGNMTKQIQTVGGRKSNWQKLEELTPKNAEAIWAHCVEYSYQDEDGQRYYDTALPIGWFVEWVKIISAQAQQEAVERERILKAIDWKVELNHHAMAKTVPDSHSWLEMEQENDLWRELAQALTNQSEEK